MKLTGPQFAQVQEALLDAYTEFGLRRMLRVQMDVELERIVGAGGLEQRTDELVRWAERREQVERLIQAAYAGNQENRALAVLLEESRHWFTAQDESPQPLDDVSPNTPEAAHQVFLSYSRKDSARMKVVYRALTDAGLTVWTDEGLAVGTDSWQQSIRQAIEDAQCMVVLMSPDANNSRWVNIEVNYALEIGLDVLPMLIRGERQESVLFGLFNAQYEDARENLPEACERLNRSLAKRPQVSIETGVPSAPVTTEAVTATERVTAAGGTAPGQTIAVGDVTRNIVSSRIENHTSIIRTSVVFALIALLGTLTVVYGTYFGGERGASVLQMAATAGSASATSPPAVVPGQLESSQTKSIATEPTPIVPSITESFATITIGSVQEIGGIPFVRVSGRDGYFWIMQTEVTNAMWQRFMEADGYNRESHWSNEGWQWREENGVVNPEYWDNSGFNLPQRPVAGISWYEAKAFANWLAEETGRVMRLPTDEEWEQTCANPDGRTYPWGNEPLPSEKLLNYNEHVGSTTDVGSYPDGVNAYGIHDLAGNVFEWTESGALRGGSWLEDESYVRCTARYELYLDYRHDGDFGVRLIMDD